MNFTNYGGVPPEDDHVILDVSQKYNKSEDVQGYGAPISVNLQKTQSIIDSPRDYHLVVERFSIPSSTIPAYVYNPAEPGTVSLSYDGSTESADLVFVPFGPVTDPASVPFNKGYHVYGIQDYLVMVNNALETALIALKASTALNPAAIAPYFKYNPQTELISLYGEEAYFDRTLLTPVIISVDTTIINQLPFFVTDYTPATQTYEFALNKYDHITEVETIATVDYLVQSQQAIGVFAFNPVQKVILISNSIPVRKAFTQINSTTGNASENNSIAILQDFKISSELNALGQRKGITYIPKTKLRLDLLGNVPLRNIDVQAYWSDINDTLYPITILPGQQFNLKLSFSRIGGGMSR
jgi:hypothetical protein